MEQEQNQTDPNQEIPPITIPPFKSDLEIGEGEGRSYEEIPRRQFFIATALSALLVLFGGGMVIREYVQRPVSPSETLLASAAESAVETAPNAFEQVTLEADAAYVFDVAAGEVLYAQNEHVQLPLASVTKIMTAHVAADILEPQDPVSISATALATEGYSGLYLNEIWGAHDLIDFALLVSSNEGAVALSEAATPIIRDRFTVPAGQDPFVWLMNEKARQYGLTQTHFLNVTGLDASLTMASAFGSARDIGVLLTTLMRDHPGLLTATTNNEHTFTTSMGERVAQNTNIITSDLPGLMASKTGFTDLAGGNLAVVFDAGLGRPIVIVVLGSTREDRFEDVEQLADAARIAITQ